MLMLCVLVWTLHKLLNFDFILHLSLTKENTEPVSSYFHRWKYVYIELKRHGMWHIEREALKPWSPLFYWKQLLSYFANTVICLVSAWINTWNKYLQLCLRIQSCYCGNPRCRLYEREPTLGPLQSSLSVVIKFDLGLAWAWACRCKRGIVKL